MSIFNFLKDITFKLKNTKLIFFILAINILIYGEKLFFYSMSCDDYDRFFLDNNVTLLVEHGRWAQVLLIKYFFMGNMHVLPYIHGLIGIFSFSIMGYLTAKYFRLKDKIKIIIVSILISASPMFGHNLLFTTNITTWITLLLGLIGFLILDKSFLYKIFGFILIVFSIGSYQSIIQILAIIVIIDFTIKIVMSNNFLDIKEAIIRAISKLFIIVFALYVSSKINGYYINYYHLHEGLRSAIFNNIFDINKIVNLFIHYPKFDYFENKFYYLYITSFILFVLATIYYILIKHASFKHKVVTLILILMVVAILPIVINLPILVQEYLPIRAYFQLMWVIAGFYIIQSSIFKGFLLTISNIIHIVIIVVSIYYINIFYDAAHRQFNSDLIRANLMVERIRNHPNYIKEPLKLKIFGGKKFNVIGWKSLYQQAFIYIDAKYKIIKYFTDLKFEEMSNREFNDIVLKQIIKEGKEVSSFPGKNSVLVYGNYAVIVLYDKSINKLINVEKLTKKTPDVVTDYEIYLQNNFIFYKKNNCSKDDLKKVIKLIVYPDLKIKKSIYELDTPPVVDKEFKFNTYAVKKDNTCIASVKLPNTKLRKIVTYGLNKNRITWKHTFDYEKKDTLTIFENKIKLIDKLTNDINYNIESFKETKELVTIEGWAFNKIKLSNNISKYITLKNDKNIFIIKTIPKIRYDVSSSYKHNYNYAGFYAEVYKQDIPKGVYDLGFLIVDESNNQHTISLGKKLKW